MYLRTLPIALLMGLCLLPAAGKLDPWLCAFALLVWVTFGTIYTLLFRRSPDLVKERVKPPSDRDRATSRLALPLLVAHWVVAGLDARFGWSAVPVTLRALGFVLVLAGLAFAGWSMLANPYASSAVRVQGERGQTVVTTGPYAIVRHPMYLGMVLVTSCGGLALGSWPAGALLLPLLAVFLRRTLLEDRMLHEALDGYTAYAQRVRSRVIPGLF